MSLPRNAFFYIRKHIPNGTSIQNHNQKRNSHQSVLFAANTREKQIRSQYIDQTTCANMCAVFGYQPSTYAGKHYSSKNQYFPILVIIIADEWKQKYQS